MSRSSLIVLLALGATFAGFVLASNAERLRGDDSSVTPSAAAGPQTAELDWNEPYGEKGEQLVFIVDGLEGCFVQLIDGQAVALQLPPSVTLEVVDTAPELKGATATKRPKPAKLNTGIEIQVPEYITTGEKIQVSTLTGEFSGRA